MIRSPLWSTPTTTRGRGPRRDRPGPPAWLRRLAPPKPLFIKVLVIPADPACAHYLVEIDVSTRRDLEGLVRGMPVAFELDGTDAFLWARDDAQTSPRNERATALLALLPFRFCEAHPIQGDAVMTGPTGDRDDDWFLDGRPTNLPDPLTLTITPVFTRGVGPAVL